VGPRATTVKVRLTKNFHCPRRRFFDMLSCEVAIARKSLASPPLPMSLMPDASLPTSWQRDGDTARHRCCPPHVAAELLPGKLLPLRGRREAHAEHPGKQRCVEALGEMHHGSRPGGRRFEAEGLQSCLDPGMA